MTRSSWRASMLVVLGLGWAASSGRAQQVLAPVPAPPAPPRGWLSATGEGGQTMDMPLVDEELTIDVDAQQATARLQQTYHNPSAFQVEGLYALDAGPGARAEGFAYWNGEEKIVGEVFERETARQVYESVTRRRRDPGLLEEKREGVFSFQVSPIMPNERKRIEVVYGQWLARRAASVELRAPVGRPNTAVTVTIDDARPLAAFESPTHLIETRRLGNGRVLVRASRARVATPVFVLRYDVGDPAWTLAGYLHREKGQDAHFALTLAAPRLPRAAAVPKDVTLVLDRSGSMAGEMIRQARAACANVIRLLGAEDRVNVLVFDQSVERLYPTPRPVTEAIRRQATDYVEMVRDGGGTNLAAALGAALATQEEGAGRPRVVLFFTDGRSDVPAVMEVAKADKRDVRVFTVGFGPDVDRRFLSRLAAGKRGRFTYIPEAADIEREVGALYHLIGAPLLVDLSLEVSGGAAADIYPRTLPDLFVDDEVRVSGRLRSDGPVTFTLRAKGERGRAVAYQVRLPMPAEARRTWVGRRWAQARVDDLLEEIAVEGERGELRGEVIDLAVAYNFATPYTAFLAIPASELDPASAHLVATARAHKAELLRRRPEAARPAEGTALAQAEKPLDQLTSGWGDRRRRQALPAPASGDAEEDSDDESSKSARLTSDSSRQKRGCAHCSAGGAGEGAPAMILAALAALAASVRRRRRQ